MSQIHDELAIILAGVDTCLMHKQPRLESLAIRTKSLDVELADYLHKLADAQRNLYEFVENAYEFSADGLVRKQRREVSEAEAECEMF